MDDVELFEDAETCEHEWVMLEFTKNKQCKLCGKWD